MQLRGGLLVARTGCRALFTELDIIALLLKRMDADAKDTAESLLSAANVSRCNASF